MIYDATGEHDAATVRLLGTVTRRDGTTEDMWQCENESVDGVLSIIHVDSLFDWYDWKGTEIDPEQLQELLDIFESSYVFDC